jgi:hypothetical protein
VRRLWRDLLPPFRVAAAARSVANSASSSARRAARRAAFACATCSAILTPLQYTCACVICARRRFASALSARVAFDTFSFSDICFNCSILSLFSSIRFLYVVHIHLIGDRSFTSFSCSRSALFFFSFAASTASSAASATALFASVSAAAFAAAAATSAAAIAAVYFFTASLMRFDL